MIKVVTFKRYCLNFILAIIGRREIHLMKLENSKLTICTKVMYAGAIVVSIFAIAFLINNIILFKNTVALYVEQGVPSSEVIKQLIPRQLLPGIFEPIAIYGGIALLLFSGGTINQKLSKCLKIVASSQDNDTIIDTNEEQVDVKEVNENTESVEETTEEAHKNYIQLED